MLAGFVIGFVLGVVVTVVVTYAAYIGEILFPKGKV